MKSIQINFVFKQTLVNHLCFTSLGNSRKRLSYLDILNEYDNNNLNNDIDNENNTIIDNENRIKRRENILEAIPLKSYHKKIDVAIIYK